jgi:ADP-ribosyl-[dinitrogen reductase] hydrolase
VNRDNVLGMFLGVAVGDALGMPAEGCDAQEIASTFGRLDHYHPVSGHHWLGDLPKGATTDDWQLTKAVAEGMIQSRGLDMNAVAAWHVQAFHESVRGWGPTTRESVAALASGTHWSQSGRTEKPDRGLGNGVCMKVAPVGAYLAATHPGGNAEHSAEAIRFLVDLAQMTHYTSLGVASGLCQAAAVCECLRSDPAGFRTEPFIRAVVAAARHGQQFLTPPASADDLSERLTALTDHGHYDTARIIREFNGSSFICHSLPFTYMFFVKNPHAIDSLYDCVSAGGDTDSNGSMLASLLGALHGTAIFPKHLVDGLPHRATVFDVAHRFCELLGL